MVEGPGGKTRINTSSENGTTSKITHGDANTFRGTPPTQDAVRRTYEVLSSWGHTSIRPDGQIPPQMPRVVKKQP